MTTTKVAILAAALLVASLGGADAYTMPNVPRGAYLDQVARASGNFGGYGTSPFGYNGGGYGGYGGGGYGYSGVGYGSGYGNGYGTSMPYINGIGASFHHDNRRIAQGFPMRPDQASTRSNLGTYSNYNSNNAYSSYGYGSAYGGSSGYGSVFHSDIPKSTSYWARGSPSTWGQSYASYGGYGMGYGNGGGYAYSNGSPWGPIPYADRYVGAFPRVGTSPYYNSAAPLSTSYWANRGNSYGGYY